MAVYRWRSGSRMCGDPQTAGEVCEALEREGNLTPGALVDASRDEDAPLHGYFEWDDEEAAERWRESQAGHIIRSVEVVAAGSTDPVRAFVNIDAGDAGRVYVNVEAALSMPDTRDEVLARALADLKAFERRYRQLEELTGVLAEIGKLVAA